MCSHPFKLFRRDLCCFGCAYHDFREAFIKRVADQNGRRFLQLGQTSILAARFRFRDFNHEMIRFSERRVDGRQTRTAVVEVDEFTHIRLAPYAKKRLLETPVGFELMGPSRRLRHRTAFP